MADGETPGYDPNNPWSDPRLRPPQATPVVSENLQGGTLAGITGIFNALKQQHAQKAIEKWDAQQQKALGEKINVDALQRSLDELKRTDPEGKSEESRRTNDQLTAAMGRLTQETQQLHDMATNSITGATGGKKGKGGGDASTATQQNPHLSALGKLLQSWQGVYNKAMSDQKPTVVPPVPPAPGGMGQTGGGVTAPSETSAGTIST